MEERCPALRCTRELTSELRSQFICKETESHLVFDYPHLRKAVRMSQDLSSETHYLNSFEAQVFARFDAIDSRFDHVERRIEAIDRRLERLRATYDEMYDRWEHVLKAVTDTKIAIRFGISGPSKE